MFDVLEMTLELSISSQFKENGLYDSDLFFSNIFRKMLWPKIFFLQLDYFIVATSMVK